VSSNEKRGEPFVVSPLFYNLVAILICAQSSGEAAEPVSVAPLVAQVADAVLAVA